MGPTLEFFALVAAEFQRTDLAMWITDNTIDNIHRLAYNRIEMIDII